MEIIKYRRDMGLTILVHHCSITLYNFLYMFLHVRPSVRPSIFKVTLLSNLEHVRPFVRSFNFEELTLVFEYVYHVF